MVKQNLKIWKNDKLYAEIFRKRAIGELPEMESSKASARKLEKYFRDGDSILDVGCGAGHYLNSYLKFLNDTDFNYTGVDITEEFINIAKNIYKDRESINFLRASIYELPFKDSQFDIVACNNVLLHLPEIKKALSELLRVGKRIISIRTLVGDRSVYIKDLKTPQDSLGAMEEFDEESGEPKNFAYYNIYSDNYIRNLIEKIDPNAKILIEPDLDFDAEKIKRNKNDFQNRGNATFLMQGMQMNGYIVLPWSFITIIK